MRKQSNARQVTLKHSKGAMGPTTKLLRTDQIDYIPSRRIWLFNHIEYVHYMQCARYLNYATQGGLRRILFGAGSGYTGRPALYEGADYIVLKEESLRIITAAFPNQLEYHSSYWQIFLTDTGFRKIDKYRENPKKHHEFRPIFSSEELVTQTKPARARIAKPAARRPYVPFQIPAQLPLKQPEAAAQGVLQEYEAFTQYLAHMRPLITEEHASPSLFQAIRERAELFVMRFRHDGLG